MNDSESIKDTVREKYTQIAVQTRDENAASCCGVGGCCTVDYEVFAEDYTKMNGYVADADLGLGCGIPTEFAAIKPGQVVLDLGSGAGNDVFVARTLIGEQGKVIGVDMTPAMIDKARENADKLGFHNVEFRLGDIESLPVGASTIDIVISNCVLNLVPDKAKAFTEMFRVMRKGGQFSVSDVVLIGALPDGLVQSAEMYAGCVAGAIQKSDYLALLARAGFENVRVMKEKRITLPDEILAQYLTPEQKQQFDQSGTGIYSITVFGEKTSCCGPGCCS